MMRGVVAQSRRILKPTGSAVFILQPNSERVGSMRPWLFEFQAWTCREWNMIQDAWWWNIAALPVCGCNTKGLLRPSLKACVWLGGPECFRNQDEVLWDQGRIAKASLLEDRSQKNSKSGRQVRHQRIYGATSKRGGVTPFNVLPVAAVGGVSQDCGDHGATTTPIVCDWWTRYICPPGGTLCDPFMGSGTTGLSALKYGCDYIGIEKMPKYFAIAERRIAAEREKNLLFPCPS
jgi:hypothetical protein